MALIHAAGAGDTDAVTLLLDGGASVGATDDSDWTALMSAAWHGHTATAALLLDRGATASDGDTALLCAAEAGHTATAALLLDRGADVDATYADATDDRGGTALMCAAARGHTSTAALLLGHGTDATATDGDGRTALSLATDLNWEVDVSKRRQMVALLLKAGADPAGTSLPQKKAVHVAHVKQLQEELAWQRSLLGLLWGGEAVSAAAAEPTAPPYLEPAGDTAVAAPGHDGEAGAAAAGPNQGQSEQQGGAGVGAGEATAGPPGANAADSPVAFEDFLRVKQELAQSKVAEAAKQSRVIAFQGMFRLKPSGLVAPPAKRQRKAAAGQAEGRAGREVTLRLSVDSQARGGSMIFYEDAVDLGLEHTLAGSRKVSITGIENNATAFDTVQLDITKWRSVGFGAAGGGVDERLLHSSNQTVLVWPRGTDGGTGTRILGQEAIKDMRAFICSKHSQ